MITTEILEAIDELSNVTLESMIDVYDALLKEYDKSSVIMEECMDAESLNGFVIFQEGAFGDEVKKMGKGQNTFVRILTLIPRILVAVFRVIKNKLSKGMDKAGKETKKLGKSVANMADDTKRKLFGKMTRKERRTLLISGLAGAAITTAATVPIIHDAKKGVNSAFKTRELSNEATEKFIKDNIKFINETSKWKNATNITVALDYESGDITLKTEDGAQITSKRFSFIFADDGVKVTIAKADKKNTWTATTTASTADVNRSEKESPSKEEGSKSKEETPKEEQTPEKVEKCLTAFENLEEFYSKYVSTADEYKLPISYEDGKVYIKEGVSSTVENMLNAAKDLEELLKYDENNLKGKGRTIDRLLVKYKECKYPDTFKKDTPEQCTDNVMKSFTRFNNEQEKVMSAINNSYIGSDNIAGKKRSEIKSMDKSVAKYKALVGVIGAYITQQHEYFSRNIKIWNDTVEVIHWVNECFCVSEEKSDDYKASAEKISNNKK